MVLAVGIGMVALLIRSAGTADAPEPTGASPVPTLLDVSAATAAASATSTGGVTGSEAAHRCNLKGAPGTVDRLTAGIDVGDADPDVVLDRLEAFWREEATERPPVDVTHVVRVADATVRGAAGGSTVSAAVDDGRVVLVADSACRPR